MEKQQNEGWELGVGSLSQRWPLRGLPPLKFRGAEEGVSAAPCQDANPHCALKKTLESHVLVKWAQHLLPGLLWDEHAMCRGPCRHEAVLRPPSPRESRCTASPAGCPPPPSQDPAPPKKPPTDTSGQDHSTAQKSAQNQGRNCRRPLTDV